MDTVKSSLDSDADPTANPSNTSQSKKCHPLCSCDICERRLHEEEENPRTRVTVFSRDDRGFTGETWYFFFLFIYKYSDFKFYVRFYFIMTI